MISSLREVVWAKRFWGASEYREKMILFETNKFFQQIIGLQSSGPGSHRGYIIAPILVSIPMLFLVFSISLNFILNIHDETNQVWSTLPTTIALFVFIILYWYLLFNRRHFYSLFEDMQDIVDESAWEWKFEIPVPDLCVFFYFRRNAFATKWKALLGIAEKNQNSVDNLRVHLGPFTNRHLNSIHRGDLPCVPRKLYNSILVFILPALVINS